MGVHRNFSLISALFLASTLVACSGGASQPSQQELNQFWAASSLKTQIPGLANGASSDGGGTGNIVTSPDGPAKQIMVGGLIKGQVTGTISVSAHDAEPCAKGYCPVESKSPLASTQISAPGYFSLVVPSHGQKITLVAKSGTSSGMHYVGELNSRVDGIEITLE